jgi:formylglycine-generating enzyme required for sulfatase activity
MENYFDEREHPVEITKAYYIGQCEVTVGQFRQFVEATGYKTTAETNGTGGTRWVSQADWFQPQADLNWKNPGFEQDDHHPVCQMSWIDCNAFCKWLSQKENKTYRLPTEAEWECASLAGSADLWPFGMYPGALQYCGNIGDLDWDDAVGATEYETWRDGYVYTAPVGSFLPNASGLYDTIVNVHEWCSDFYDDKFYTYSPKTDPVGPPHGKDHIERGGSFLSHFFDSRSAKRGAGPPDETQNQVGFRVVMEKP